MDGRGWADGESVGSGVWQSLQTRPYSVRGMVGAGLDGWQAALAGDGVGWQMTLEYSGDPPSPPDSKPTATGGGESFTPLQ